MKNLKHLATHSASRVLIACGVLALALGGCGGTTDEAATVVDGGGVVEEGGGVIVEEGGGVLADEGCTTASPCEITFRWWGGDDRQRRTLDAIALFEETNPDITVLAQPVSWAGYYDQLLIELAAGTAPDVFQLDAARPREFGQQGVLLPLNGLLDTTNLPAAQVDEGSWDGQIYAAPHTGNGNAVLLNAAVFDEAGVALPDTNTWTWDEFFQIAAELKAALPAGSYALELRPVDFGRTWIAQQYDGGFFSADGDVGASADVITRWFEFMKGLEDDGYIAPASETVANFMVGVEETQIGNNRAAMMFAPSPFISQVAASSGSDIQIGLLPGETSEPYAGTRVDVAMYYGVAANSSHPGAAVRLVNFLVNDVDAGLIFGTDRGIPLNSAVSAAVYAEADSVAQRQFDWLDSALAVHSNANPRSPGGWLAEDVNRNTEAVLFGSLTPAAGATAFITDSQASIDNAR